MPDDTDLSLEELMATRERGIPVSVVTSRIAYESATQVGVAPVLVRLKSVGTGLDLSPWLNGQGTSGGSVRTVRHTPRDAATSAAQAV